jgi:hypothetical protein
MSSPPGDHLSPEELGTDLLRAVDDEDLQRVTELLNEGADVNYRGRVGETPLIVTAMNLNLDIIRLLLEKGADRTIRSSPDGDFEGKNALEVARVFARDHPGNPDVPLIFSLLSDDPSGVPPPGGEPAGGAKKKKKKGGRRFTRKQCKKFKCAKMGFTQKASCRPYKNCYRSTAGVKKKRRTHKRHSSK